jgi:hypothetical protein
LSFRQFTFPRFLEWNQAVGMNIMDALESFIADKDDKINHMYAALLVKFEVVDRTLTFVDANNFTGLAVDYD